MTDAGTSGAAALYGEYNDGFYDQEEQVAFEEEAEEDGWF